MHALYGGVVPEIASRKHVQAIAALSDKALADAGLTKRDIDAVAVTYPRGLSARCWWGCPSPNPPPTRWGCR